MSRRLSLWHGLGVSKRVSHHYACTFCDGVSVQTSPLSGSRTTANLALDALELSSKLVADYIARVRALEGTSMYRIVFTTSLITREQRSHCSYTNKLAHLDNNDASYGVGCYTASV